MIESTVCVPGEGGEGMTWEGSDEAKLLSRPMRLVRGDGRSSMFVPVTPVEEVSDEEMLPVVVTYPSLAVAVERLSKYGPKWHEMTGEVEVVLYPKKEREEIA